MKRVRKMTAMLVRIVLAASVAMLVLLKTAFAAEVKIDDKNFPDINFRYWVLNNVDTDKNGSLSEAEIKAVTTFEKKSSMILNLKGIEYFTELKRLVFQGEITGRVDLRKNTKLVEVNLANNFGVTTIDLSACTNLVSLDVSNCTLRSLDVSKNTKLASLDCHGNWITTLNLSNNTALVELNCSRNSIKSLDVSKLTKLQKLICSETYLTKLDISKNTKLRIVDCAMCAISSIVFGPTYEGFSYLDCRRNNLASLDVSKLYLYTLKAQGNRLNAATLKLGGYVEILYNESQCINALVSDYPYSNLPLPVSEYFGDSEGETLLIDLPVTVGKEVSVKYYRGDDYYGSGPVYTTTQIAGRQFTIPKVTIVNNARYFLGWSYAPHATAPDFKTGDKITVYHNTVLYPVWKDKTYSVTFDLNGGTSGAPAAITGIPCTLPVAEIPASSPVREGYYFLGWSVEKTVSHADVKSGEAVYTAACDMLLYAIWKPRTNKISFNLNGGSGTTPATISVFSGKSASIPKANVSRSGYWFLGWSTNKNATSATYKSDSKISVTKDTVLYAVWKSQTPSNCSLVFDANGGTNPPATITAANGTTVTIPSSSVKRDGYWFLGWATSKTAATAQYKSGNTLKLTTNTTLYAVWKKK